MRIRELHHERSNPHESFAQSLRGGWTLLRSDRTLLIFTMVWPTHFESLNDPVGLGLVISAIAPGMVLGAFGYEKLVGRMSTIKLLRVSILVSTAAFYRWVFYLAGWSLPCWRSSPAWRGGPSPHCGTRRCNAESTRHHRGEFTACRCHWCAQHHHLVNCWLAGELRTLACASLRSLNDL